MPSIIHASVEAYNPTESENTEQQSCCFWRHGPIQSLCGRMCCNHRRLYVDAAWIDIAAILNVALLNLSAVISINYTASF